MFFLSPKTCNTLCPELLGYCPCKNVNEYGLKKVILTFLIISVSGYHLDLKSIFSSHKWSVGGFSKRYHWKLRNTELAVESRLWWNMKNSYALLCLIQTIFCTLFFLLLFFFLFKEETWFQEGRCSWRKTSVSPSEELLGFLSMSLTRKVFICSNWQQTRQKILSYEASWKEANIWLCSFLDSIQVTLGFYLKWSF